jgi:hypothetical protein
MIEQYCTFDEPDSDFFDIAEIYKLFDGQLLKNGYNRDGPFIHENICGKQVVWCKVVRVEK